MLKFFALTLLALHCNCQNVIGVKGNNVVHHTGATHLPVKTVSGLSNYGLSGVGALPVSSYLSQLPALNYGLNINGLNLGYLNGAVRNSVYGNSIYGSGLYGSGLYGSGLYGSGLYGNVVPSVYSSGVNIAPSVYGYGAPHQSLLAIRQPAVQAYSVAQPAVAVARQAVHVAQPLIAHQNVHSSEAVRPVSAAIHQLARTVEYRDVPHNEHPIVPQEVVVEPSDQPINIHFRSRSSTVRLTHDHIPGEPGTVEQTQSQDEPSKVIHEVVKPVIQEIREVIQPYRQVTQEIQPVVENVHRIVSSGEAVRQQYVNEQPIVRQVVRQAQPLSVAVAQPAISIAQPISYAQRAISVAQPVAYAQRAISLAQPINQYQTVAVPQAYNVGQPIVSSIQRFAQPFVGYNSIGYNGLVSQQIPSIGYNRVVSQQIPSIAIREQVREVRQPENIQVVRNEGQRNTDHIEYAESD